MGQELMINVMKVALTTIALFLACLLSDLKYNFFLLREINIWESFFKRMDAARDNIIPKKYFNDQTLSNSDKNSGD